jgi:hypothetical protein
MPVEVKLGLSDGAFIEVASGALKVGDLVVLGEKPEEGQHQDRQQGQPDRDDREDKPRRLPRKL